jgi:uncharacterized protein
MTRKTSNSKLRCSTCGRTFLLDETDSPPFCSERCKLVDLGRWLNEDVSVPHEGGPSKGEAVDEDRGDAEDEES